MEQNILKGTQIKVGIQCELWCGTFSVSPCSMALGKLWYKVEPEELGKVTVLKKLISSFKNIKEIHAYKDSEFFLTKVLKRTSDSS